FLANLQRYYFDDFVYGNRVFNTDGTPGDNTEVPLGQTRQWSGVGKLSNTSIKNVEMSYQAIFNTIDGQRTDYLFRYDPDGLSKQHTYSIVHGLEWTHTLNKKSFYNFACARTISITKTWLTRTSTILATIWPVRRARSRSSTAPTTKASRSTAFTR